MTSYMLTHVFGVAWGTGRVAFRRTTARWSTTRFVPASQRNLHLLPARADLASSV